MGIIFWNTSKSSLENERNERLRKLESIEVEAAHKSILFPGVIDILNSAKSKGIRTGLFTRNCSAVVNVVLSKFPIHFDMIVTRDATLPQNQIQQVFQFS